MPGLIDVHHHFMSQAYLDAVGVERAASPGSAGHVEPWTAQQSLEFMDMAGIEASIVSVSAPGIDMGTPEETAKLAREVQRRPGGNGPEEPEKVRLPRHSPAARPRRVVAGNRSCLRPL